MNIKVKDTTTHNGKVYVNTIPRLDDLFNENNTEWDEGELVYQGSLEDLADETGYTLDEIYEAFGEYQDASREAVEEARQLRDDYYSGIRELY